ncbi:unnamed protein product, partial [Ixodes hexagonus]
APVVRAGGTPVAGGRGCAGGRSSRGCRPVLHSWGSRPVVRSHRCSRSRGRRQTTPGNVHSMRGRCSTHVGHVWRCGGHVGATPLLRGELGSLLDCALGHHLGLLFLLLQRHATHLLGVPVEEEIDHDLPRDVSDDGPSHAQHLPGQHPPHEADGVLALVVAGDGNVHVAQAGIRIAEGNHGQVHVRRFRHGLVVRPRVADHQQAGLAERRLDLHDRRPSGDGRGAREAGKLEDRPLAVRPRRDGAHLGRVLNGHNGAGREQKLLPRLLQVNQTPSLTVRAPLEAVLLHLEVQVGGAHVGLGRQEPPHIVVLQPQHAQVSRHRDTIRRATA